MKFIPKCSEKFQEGTGPLRETFGNLRGRENDEKGKNSPNGIPWGVISKSVPGRYKISTIHARGRDVNIINILHCVT